MEKKFADVLKFCWEGLLYEYLRRVGCPLRDRELDPRHFVMRYWRRSMLDPSVQPGFVPFYAKREVRKGGNPKILSSTRLTEGIWQSPGFSCPRGMSMQAQNMLCDVASSTYHLDDSPHGTDIAFLKRLGIRIA